MGGTHSKAKAKHAKDTGSPSVSSIDGEEFYQEPDEWSDEEEETTTQLLKKVVSSALVKQDVYFYFLFIYSFSLLSSFIYFHHCHL